MRRAVLAKHEQVGVAELIRRVEQGLPFRALTELAGRSGLNVPEVAEAVGIAERTLARRKAAGRLAMPESERLVRISALFEKALELFEGDVRATVVWLTTTRKVLNNESPLAYARTELGAREVENLIGRLEHGVFS
jgi:putative toxin-antitoxin system antitoxin component (TIGR02293 family)